jgi:hypothetical protein
MVQILRHCQPKGAATARPNLQCRASTPPLHFVIPSSIRIIRILAAAACVLCASCSLHATAESPLSPIELKGKHHPMMGPEQSVSPTFPGDGWITAFSVHVIDSRGKTRDHAGIFCHAILQKDGEGGIDPAQSDYKTGVFEESMHLLLSEGQNNIRFPDGFGVRVDSKTTYGMSAMLQSDDDANDGTYRFAVERNFVSSDRKPPLKSLVDLLLRIEDGTGPHYCGGLPGFMVPPGLSVFEKKFDAPYDARVHYITTHLHQFAKTVALLDERTGKALYQAPVKRDARGGLVEIPVYSSVEGFRLEKGRHYVYRVAYDNPSGESSPSMANLRMYLEDPTK